MCLILCEERKQTKQSCLKNLFGIPDVTQKELGLSRHCAAYLIKNHTTLDNSALGKKKTRPAF